MISTPFDLHPIVYAACKHASPIPAPTLMKISSSLTESFSNTSYNSIQNSRLEIIC